MLAYCHLVSSQGLQASYSSQGCHITFCCPHANFTFSDGNIGCLELAVGGLCAPQTGKCYVSGLVVTTSSRKLTFSSAHYLRISHGGFGSNVPAAPSDCRKEPAPLVDCPCCLCEPSLSTWSSLFCLYIGTRRTVQMDHTFFPGYRRTLLSPEEILLSIEIPYSREVRWQELVQVLAKLSPLLSSR